MSAPRCSARVGLLFVGLLADAGGRHERERSGPPVQRDRRRMTASASTAGSSATCRTSSFGQSRAGRAPASCASTASAPTPGDRIAAGQIVRVPPQGEEAPAPEEEAAAARRRSATTRSTSSAALVIHEDRGRDRAQQAARPRHPGRHQDARPSRPAARRPRRGRRAAPEAGPPARQGHVGRAAASPARPRAAAFFAKAFSGRTARKVYWALVVGVPAIDGRHDRAAARQAARHRRREDACRRGGGPAGADPLPGDRARRQPRRLGRAAAA